MSYKFLLFIISALTFLSISYSPAAFSMEGDQKAARRKHSKPPNVPQIWNRREELTGSSENRKKKKKETKEKKERRKGSTIIPSPSGAMSAEKLTRSEPDITLENTSKEHLQPHERGSPSTLSPRKINELISRKKHRKKEKNKVTVQIKPASCGLVTNWGDLQNFFSRVVRKEKSELIIVSPEWSRSSLTKFVDCLFANYQKNSSLPKTSIYTTGECQKALTEDLLNIGGDQKNLPKEKQSDEFRKWRRAFKQITIYCINSGPSTEEFIKANLLMTRKIYAHGGLAWLGLYRLDPYIKEVYSPTIVVTGPEVARFKEENVSKITEVLNRQFSDEKDYTFSLGGNEEFVPELRPEPDTTLSTEKVGISESGMRKFFRNGEQ